MRTHRCIGWFPGNVHLFLSLSVSLPLSGELWDENSHMHRLVSRKRPSVSICLCLSGELSGENSVRVSVSVSVSSQNGIVALGKAHTRSAPSLSSLPKVALKTVPMFVWLNTDRSRPWRVECRPLPFSTPLSFRRSML